MNKNNLGGGIGYWGLGIGDWGLGPIPNPQSPIPNPQSPTKSDYKIYLYIFNYYVKNNNIKNEIINYKCSKETNIY